MIPGPGVLARFFGAALHIRQGHSLQPGPPRVAVHGLVDRQPHVVAAHLQRLAQGEIAPGAPGPRKPRALILTPTRELAVQVNDSLRSYGKHLKLNTAAIYGGAGMGPQFDLLKRGVDILVATPGRLMDHMERGSIKLDQIDVLVLDEADRMLDMGFLPAIKRILAKVPALRQTLLFSATFEAELKKLAIEFMRNPQQVQILTGNTVAENITHRAHPVDGSRKRDLLIEILAKRHTHHCDMDESASPRDAVKEHLRLPANGCAHGRTKQQLQRSVGWAAWLQRVWGGGGGAWVMSGIAVTGVVS
jgi:hypothetical protein